jgi:hypothetical protein
LRRQARGEAGEAQAGREAGVSLRTKILLVLFRTANMAVIALGASIVTLMVKGFGVEGTRPLWPWWFMAALVAMLSFRYAFYRSLRRDSEAEL